MPFIINLAGNYTMPGLFPTVLCPRWSSSKKFFFFKTQWALFLIDSVCFHSNPSTFIKSNVFKCMQAYVAGPL